MRALNEPRLMFRGAATCTFAPAPKIARLYAALHQFDDLRFAHAGLRLYRVKTGIITQGHSDNFGSCNCPRVFSGRSGNEVVGKSAVGHIRLTGGGGIWLPARRPVLREACAALRLLRMRIKFCFISKPPLILRSEQSERLEGQATNRTTPALDISP